MALKRDIKFALRMQLKKPGFTAVAVLTLALGIGANTAIFGLVNAVFLKSLPYANPDRLLLLFEANKQGWLPAPYLNFLDWRQMNRSFEEMACFRAGRRVLLNGAGPQRVECKWVSANLFSTLGVTPALGRTFTSAEDGAGGQPVVVLDHSFWRERYGANPDVIGRSLTVDGETFVVVGVAPAGFRFSEDSEMYFPIHPRAYQEFRYDHNALKVIGRLRPGVTEAQAQADLKIVARRLEERYPKENAGDGIAAIALTQWVAGYSRSLVLVFVAAVVFVLLIACVNVASLLLVRLNERNRELAVRAALGADRGSLVRQTLIDSLLLAVEGGVLGLLLASVGLDTLTGFVPPEMAPAVRIDGWVLVFTLLLCCGTAVLFGTIPGLKSSRVNVNEFLKEGERSGTGIKHGRFRDLLVVSEIALALVLLIGAGLMIRSAIYLMQVDPGFRGDRVVSMKVEPPDSRFFDQGKTANGMDLAKVFRAAGDYTSQLIDGVHAVPGVQAVASVFPLVMTGDSASFQIAPEGTPPPANGNYRRASRFSITEEYFRVMGIPVLKGRAFRRTDNLEAPRVAIISQAMAREFWPGQEPLGKTFQIPNFETQVFTVIGLVGDVRQGSPQAKVEPQVYLSQLQWPGGITLVIRTPLPVEQIARAVRGQIAGFDKEAPVSDVSTITELMARNMSHRRQVTLLLSIFAALALILATVGIYGVMSHIVGQRTREMGLRIAIGASPRLVLRMVLGRALLLSVLGVALGLAGALALTGWLGTWLYGVTATDPLTYAGISALIMAVALGSTYWPARRAASVDPMTALRCE